jgi:hypothetical protein
MVGWWKKDSGPAKAQLREAYLKRLAEVLGMPDKDLIANEASYQGSLEPSPETHAAKG